MTSDSCKSSSRGARLEHLLLGLLILLYLVPLWAFPYPVTQDGPAHLENAVILREYFEPSRDVLRQYYYINTRRNLNWPDHLLLAALTSFLPPQVAEKLLLSGYLVLLPLALRYALTSVRPGSQFLTVLAFPALQNWFFNMGLHNFLYSLVLLLVTLGYWLRHHGRLTPRRVLVLALMLALTYFAHLFALVVVLLLIGTLTAAWFLTDLLGAARGGRLGAVLRSPVRIRLLLFSAAALLPSALLLAEFAMGPAARTTSGPVFNFRPAGLLHPRWLTSYDQGERAWATALLYVVVALVSYGAGSRLLRRRLERQDVLALAPLILALACIVAPDWLAGGGYVRDRLKLCLFFSTLLWLATHPYPRWLRQAVILAAVIIGLPWLAIQWEKRSELNAHLAEYLSVAPYLEPGSTLLPISFAHHGWDGDQPISLDVGVFRHAAGYLAAERGVVNLRNYEASFTFFPIRYRPALDPTIEIGKEAKAGSEPACTDFAGYAQHTGSRVDYVLLWAFSERYHGDRCSKRIFEQLERGYDLIYTSPQRGQARLYRSRSE